MLVNGSSLAATVNFGIDLRMQQKVSPVLRPIPLQPTASAGQWQQGIIQGSANLSGFERDGIILGIDLASDLNVVVGDTIQMVSPLGSIPTPIGLMPRSASVVVQAIHIAGMPEYDKLYSYVPLNVARLFSSQTATSAMADFGQIDILEIKTANPRKIKSIAAELQKSYPMFLIEDWSSFDSSLYSAMHFEKYIMLTILGLMFIIASFNMSSNIYKTIIQKKKSIGILKTIGFQNRELMQLFYFQGLVVGTSGILCGIILSSAFLLLQQQFGLIQLPVGNMPNLVLPVDLRWADFLLIPLVSFILTWFSIYLPARKAMLINPIALIRNS
jgi:lipoprotein-releasing system permease protein